MTSARFKNTRVRRHRRIAGLAIALALAGGGTAQAAASDPSEGGLWYYNQSGMEELHQRTTGEGVTIAVIDTAINPDAPGLEGADLYVREPSYCAPRADGRALPATGDGESTQHGTGITSLLVGSGVRPDGKRGVPGIAPGASVRFYSISPGPQNGSCTGTAGGDSQAFRDAVADGADIINISMATQPLEEDLVAAVRSGVVVVHSGGNHNEYLEPGLYSRNGLIEVGTVMPGLTLDPGSPTGPTLGVVAPGSEFLCFGADLVTEARCTGSSTAAAYTSGVLALAMSAHPDATSNQILQAMVRSTGGGALHEPLHDDAWGFGLVNARLLVGSDPTSFPDVSPFVREGADEVPPAAAFVGTGPWPSTEDDRGEAAGGSAASDTTALLILGAGWGIGILVLAGVVIAVLVATSHRRQHRPPFAPAPPHPHRPPGAGYSDRS